MGVWRVICSALCVERQVQLRVLGLMTREHTDATNLHKETPRPCRVHQFDVVDRPSGVDCVDSLRSVGTPPERTYRTEHLGHPHSSTSSQNGPVRHPRKYAVGCYFCSLPQASMREPQCEVLAVQQQAVGVYEFYRGIREETFRVGPTTPRHCTTSACNLLCCPEGSPSLTPPNPSPRHKRRNRIRLTTHKGC